MPAAGNATSAGSADHFHIFPAEADLLVQFPVQGILGLLPALHAALRKLPAAAPGAPPNEQPAVIVHQNDAHTSENDECQIDSIAQSWAVISGAGEPGRARRGIAAAEERLVRGDDRLILLLAPPFDQGGLDPGYIKGYVPGIRENGGQYTHAAAWFVMAEAMLGNGRRAVELFDLINPIRHAEPPTGSPDTASSPTSWPATSTGVPRTPGGAGGPGTPARPGGSTGWRWSRSWGCGASATAWSSTRASRATGPGSRSSTDTGRRPTGSRSRIPTAVERHVLSVTLDGQDVPGATITLADDARTHDVHVVLGGSSDSA